MIQEVIGLVKDKTGSEQPQFYKLRVKYTNQGEAYTGTDIFGSEKDLRTVLKDGGIADAASNNLFANAH
jgi:hypothetical protein